MLWHRGTIDTNHSNATLAGNIINSGYLMKAGQGKLTFSETSIATHAGTEIQGGVLVVNGTHHSPIFQHNGLLTGTGTVGDVLTTAGVVSPGDGSGTGFGKVGILRASQLTLGGSATLLIDINGPTPGTEYDRIQVPGTTNIGFATLGLNPGPGLQLPPGAQLTILTNATGHFLFLPEGAIIPTSGGKFRISYVGGDGNDVVLTHDDNPNLALVHPARTR